MPLPRHGRLIEAEIIVTTGVVLSAGTKWAFQLDGLITLSEDGNFNGNAIVVKRATDFEMYSSNGKGAIQGQGYKQRISGSGQNARLLRVCSISPPSWDKRKGTGVLTNDSS